MSSVAWLLKWLLKAAIFFTLFAFALNNTGDVTLRFFFGRHWTAPMVLVVLCAFALGLMLGVAGMVPRWWRHRRDARGARKVADELRQAQAQVAERAAPTMPPPGL